MTSPPPPPPPPRYRCGHCKKLAPEYEAAATRLKKADPPVPLAKVSAPWLHVVLVPSSTQSVHIPLHTHAHALLHWLLSQHLQVDCTANQDTCGKFGVSGYPTLKIFRNGEMSADYAGPRQEGSLVAGVVL